MKHVPLRYVGAALGLLVGLLVIHYGLFKTAWIILATAGGWFAGRILGGETGAWDFRQSRDDEPLE